MKKVMAVLTVIGLALSIGNGMAVSAGDDYNPWDEVPDVYLPVRTR